MGYGEWHDVLTSGPMPPEVEKLLDEALRLPEGDREALALALLDSVGDEAPAAVDRAWRDEIRRRIDELDHGQVRVETWEVVRKRVFAR